MWISVKINPPPESAIVLVRMDDCTEEKECYAVAEYSSERGFEPVNVHSSYDGYGEPVLDFPVISWKYICE